jgi:hypothetical protein
MPILVICGIEAVCLVMDLFFFHAAILHILLVLVLILAGLLRLFRRRKSALHTFLAIPVVIALSTTGYLVELHLKDLVGKVDSACFKSGQCDIPKSYLGYRVQIAYKADGRAKDAIIIDGYNHSTLIYDPAARTFARGEL